MSNLLIVRQYLIQFYPAYIYQQTKVELLIAGGNFISQDKNRKTTGLAGFIPKR